MKALSVCSTPGCPRLAKRGKCEECAKAARKRSEARRVSPHDRGYDRAWRRTRGRYIKTHPTCEEPGCTQPAETVDHLDDLGPNGPNGHRDSNLHALCKPHHSKRTARRTPGGWNG